MTTRDPITVQPPLLQIVAVPVVRGQTMADRFVAFDAANPHVYNVIEAEALRRAATTTLELVRAAREVASVLRDAIDPPPTAFTAWAEGNDNSGDSREE